MNFFKQSSEQARQAFTMMPMQSRVISVMLVVAIAIGLAFLVRGSQSANSLFLFGGRVFAEHELDEIEMAFSRAGLSDWQRDGRRIKIPRDTKAAFLAALEESSTLPSTLQSSVQEAIAATSVFDSSDLLEARQQAGKAEDLSKRIAMFPEVKSASVVHDRGERRGLSQSRAQSASVFVVPEGTAPLPRHRINAIKEMVRAAYAGMAAEDVYVQDAYSTTLSSLDDDDDPLLRKQQDTEALYKRKIRSALIAYPAVVEVSAEIDPTMEVEKTVLSYDAEGTTISNRSRKIESSNSRQANRGVPGTTPNAIGNRATSIDENVDNQKLSDKQDEVQKVAGQQFETNKVAPLTVKSISVTVGLPRSYFKSIYLQRQLEQDPTKSVADLPPLSDADFEKLKEETFATIKDAVSSLLPARLPGEDRTDLVQAYVTPDLPPETMPATDTRQVALTWLADSWQTVALVLLAVIALLVARSAARGSGETPPVDFAEGFGLELPQAPPELDPENDVDAMLITGANLKDELISIVESNPEVAANVIRSWVAEAA
jgi:flagellar M-ring protein FliF